MVEHEYAAHSKDGSVTVRSWVLFCLVVFFLTQTCSMSLQEEENLSAGCVPESHDTAQEIFLGCERRSQVV